MASDPRHSWRVGRTLAALASCCLLIGLSACAGTHFPQSTLHPDADASLLMDHLFTHIFAWAVFVFVVVEGLLIYTVIRFRARPDSPEPKPVHGHTVIEIAWTLAPALIIVFIAVPTIRTIFKVDGAAPPGAMQIEVIGHQWWWEFKYPGLGVVTANELHLPVDKAVHLSLQSADVIHSFWVPRLSGKRDVFPGDHVNHLEITPDSIGTFLGQCAEFCGESHANMRFRVMVQDSADFAAWVADQQAGHAPIDSSNAEILAGYQAFTKIRNPATNSCIVCHTIKGISAGVIGPNLTHVGSRTTIAGGTLPFTPAGITTWLSNPPAAKPGSKMPNIGLTPDEIRGLIAFLQSMK